ncbi:LysR family transcriptional regulator [Pseudoroseomonas wenyumeiae]
MKDLNDFSYFAAVVDHGGFSAAGRALGVQKSLLSRRVLALEERLGVRLQPIVPPLLGDRGRA